MGLYVFFDARNTVMAGEIDRIQSFAVVLGGRVKLVVRLSGLLGLRQTLVCVFQLYRRIDRARARAQIGVHVSGDVGLEIF